ncbi:MAG: hypothetical protein A2747_01780 [Candidatus Yonathbacteria bacterium RIFCSPHIGHO2_01_FULL_44_41]|uniref:EamA domain-containing protein n=1 Tax=Candidatus Yonathbacteria bacterium RIFCSPHIGHO2_02_FULL_44_14 TaxID=1802724 RepID=A0A1G2SAB4_9BACT|nr:MAG: hypothetical protein A2747_01780 [Candidatus Yonathbacteria bacterium RIFCSPHIGHO2_01_FULL_44_41]OHA81592.1 MAG: hypothetical protein A3D51_02355 [Candidatus Yonathbacteria bacterium RIFCSPHIGHO2_02_FULL_44_14]OHA81773.1 MAG: hypothetical protein A3B06_02290 [Candidatus Yonathbacteria bacterium RIFCSPLOWO2_01_FULL_43_20]
MLNQAILILFAGGTFLTLGDITAKKWVELSDGRFSVATPYYVLSLAFYCVGVTLFAFTLKQKNIAIATVILIFFNVLTVSIAGYLLFNEKFSALQILGIAIGFSAVVILEIAE